MERAQRTHTGEFYKVADLTWTVAELNRDLQAWERVYNTVRPHQALGYRTPEQFLREFAQTGERVGVTHVLDEYTGLTSLAVQW